MPSKTSSKLLRDVVDILNKGVELNTVCVFTVFLETNVTITETCTAGGVNYDMIISEDSLCYNLHLNLDVLPRNR